MRPPHLLAAAAAVAADDDYDQKTKRTCSEKTSQTRKKVFFQKSFEILNQQTKNSFISSMRKKCKKNLECWNFFAFSKETKSIFQNLIKIEIFVFERKKYRLI